MSNQSAPLGFWLSWGKPTLGVLIGAVFGAGVYVKGYQETLSQNTRTLSDQIAIGTMNSQRLALIENWKASTDDKWVRVPDQTIYATRTASEISENRIRIARVEDSLVTIKEQLNRIERKIDHTP